MKLFVVVFICSKWTENLHQRVMYQSGY